MKVTVIRTNDIFIMILEYLHYKMDNSYSREFINIENDKPKFILSEPSFEWNGINFILITTEEYKKNYDHFNKYSELILEHDSFTVLSTFIEESTQFIIKKLYLPKQELRVYRSDRAHWESESKLKEKTIETVYLPQKIKDELLIDITKFNEPKTIERYKQLNINHIRMYMLYGPPGTGKTSLIKSIATHLKKNICYLNIGPDTTDTILKTCIGHIPENSILCLEDIDALFGEERKTKNSSLTFSGFINTFDGFASPENLLVFMTTNNLPQLENAVIRRISYFIEFRYAVKEQIKQMFDMFFPGNDFETFYKNIGDNKITINILEKFFIKYLFDDIVEASKQFPKFANGELKVELNNCSKLYT